MSRVKFIIRQTKGKAPWLGMIRALHELDINTYL